MKKLFFLTLLVLLFFACEKVPNINSDSDNNNDTPADTTSTSSRTAEYIIEANNTFALDFIKEVNANEEEPNYMISPVSLSLALGMAYNGANNATKAAFESMMYYEDLPDGANAFNRQLIEELTSSDSGAVMEIANSMWIEKTFPVKEDFITLNQNYYDAEVQNLDFSAPATLDTINNWVSHKTHDKIPKILEEISPDAVLYLINALYFNANWHYAFSKEHTQTAPFYTQDGNHKEVQMMTMTAKLPFFSNSSFTSVKLPYENKTFDMTVILPNSNSSTDQVINDFCICSWDTWQASYDTTQEVAVFLPKFKHEYENRLNDELTALGLSNAFSPSQADFSRISDISIFISLVLQKTFIDVNESGTEAAAVTLIGFETTAMPNEPQPITFYVDRPFLYIITDKATGSICFMGKVGSPEYEEE